MFKKTKMYEIDGFSIELNKDHRLPEFQEHFAMYDRFLPFLADHFKDSSQWIIDIGANVGDSIMAMLRHTAAHFLAVEPAEVFHKLLLKNMGRIPEEFSGRVISEQAFIAGDGQAFEAKMNDGTAKREEVQESAVQTLSILKLLEKHNIDIDKVALIKSDTDGFDADCIMSAGTALKDNSPIVYYENQIDNQEQMTQYDELVDFLSECGYQYFYLFDNFGNYMFSAKKESMKNFNRYLQRINQKLSARTIYYIDVMACKDGQKSLCEAAINKYLDSFGKIKKI